MPGSARVGASFAVGSMLSVQLGLAASVGFVDRLGASGVAALRLVAAALLIVLLARPWTAAFDRRALAACAGLGVVTAGMTLLFMGAVSRIPLGTASAIEFLGPLSVAALTGRRRSQVWVLLAGAGVVALTEPWHSGADAGGVACALGAAVCWGVYVVLTQRVGDRVTGLAGLGVSFPVAALVASGVALAIDPATVTHLDAGLLLAGLGLAVLVPVVPFSLEMLALRRLSATAFGTLMSLEPAIALTIGAVALAQIPGPLALAGILCVVAAGIGATRSGARGDPPAAAPAAAPAARSGAHDAESGGGGPAWSTPDHAGGRA